MLSFKGMGIVEINEFIAGRRQLVEKLNNALQNLKHKEAEITYILTDVDFSLCLIDFSLLYTSIYSYLGIYTSEIVEGEKELAIKNKT